MRGAELRRRLIWAAFAAVLVFVAWVAVRFDEVALVVYTHSDNAASPVIAELFGERDGQEVILGNYPWLETLYALLATKGLPAHETLWEAGPFLLLAAAIACVWWSTRRAVSGEAGAAVALALAAPAPALFLILVAPGLRGTTFAHVALLSVFVVTLPALGRWGWGRRLAWAGALMLTIAPGAASDPQFFPVAGPLPFLAAVAAAWALGILPRAAALLAGGACLAGVGLGRALIAIAESGDVTYRDFTFPLADGEQVWSNLGLLFEDVALFFHGQFGGEATALNLMLAATGLLAIVAVPLLLALALRSARAVAAGWTPAQTVLAVFWTVVVTGLWAAFLTSSAPENLSAVRYISMTWPALLVLAVLFWRERAVTGIAAIAIVAAVLGWLQLADGRYTDPDPEGPTKAEAEQLVELIEREDLARGYGDYWDSLGLIYLSDYEARVYPVGLCGPGQRGRCPYDVHSMDYWYDAVPGSRSFYLHHSTREAEQIGPPPPGWGPFERKTRIGDLVVYVYDRDLAPLLGEEPPRLQRSPATARSRRGSE